jgi:predicted RNase H-like HicB family nuclease
MPINYRESKVRRKDMRVTVQAEFRLFGRIRQQGRWFIAHCPPLDITTQGKTLEEAKKNLIEASQLFIVSCLERGTLDRALKELGFIPLSGNVRMQNQPPGTFQFPVPIPFGFKKQVECHA